MSTWRGVPLEKAIIVRHTPRDHDTPLGRKGTGAISMSSSSRALDYSGRYDKYADKGDIDRRETDHDRELAADAHQAGTVHDRDAVDRLTYAAREESYATKGAGLADASLWDQHGPVKRDVVQAEMERAGGAFVDSFVSIGREYTHQLGIETKEDLQRFARATWTESVEKWGVIQNPEDIRWVAAAHFDANRSIHIHYYTWSAKGEIEPGWTVGREATREAKEVIYKTGYVKIVEERNERSNYLRDLARHEAVRQCGGRVDDRAERRLDAKADRLGYSERLSASSDIAPDKKVALERLQTRISDELERGYGRLSDNWKANATARDIVRELQESSPSFATVWQAHEKCLEVQADIKGYGGGFEKERTVYLRAERDDFLNRVAAGVRNAHLPDDVRERMTSGRKAWEDREKPTREEIEERRRLARERREKERKRAEEAQARMPLSKVLAQHEAARDLGTSLKSVQGLGRDMAHVARGVERSGARNYDEAPREVRLAANAWASKMLATGKAEGIINRAVPDICARNPERSPAEVRESIMASVQDRFARNLVAEAAEGRFGHAPEYSRMGGGGLGGMADVAESLVYAASAAMAGGSRGGSGSRRPDAEAERQRFDDAGRDRI